MSKKVTAFYLLLIFNVVVPEDGSVYDYNPGNFKHQIEGLDGNFIMFYAPWCRHCTEFEPIWSELAELVNTRDSKFAIAQVDCTQHANLCQEVDITGYPSLLYFHKSSFSPVEYKGTRDLPSLTLFLSEVFTIRSEKLSKSSDEVKISTGMAYLTDHNIEKFVSKGQHFIMFYAPWCRASQKLSPTWAELALQYTHNPYIQVGKVNCMDSEMTCKTFDIKQYPYLLWIVNGRIMGVASSDASLNDLNEYVDRMLLAENHDPDKFMKKKKALPVARISEETFETFLEKELVFVNFFAPWCAHCMQLNPLWTKLGEKFLNESRVLIADVDCISGLPTLILYKQKKIVNVDHGSKPLESLISLVSGHLEPGTQDQTEQPATKDEL
ncbi:Thioredoxin domain-containing protein 5 [Operophtera brumata]|uniref:Thioredoxin domain-containing protein 5 n=1 Tax=Operophtera brumata TaxID=104452 RepID=A0A0L7LQY7_OPEBR|nr:Thioredoxin domain-containing protein 5 [Operophtera brumata]